MHEFGILTTPLYGFFPQCYQNDDIRPLSLSIQFGNAFGGSLDTLVSRAGCQMFLWHGRKKNFALPNPIPEVYRILDKQTQKGDGRAKAALYGLGSPVGQAMLLIRPELSGRTSTLPCLLRTLILNIDHPTESTLILFNGW